MEGAERIDTVVIGAGQAGLCMSYVLQEQGRDHVVLEKRRTLEQWRSLRWDSFRVNSPATYARLLGQPAHPRDHEPPPPLAETIQGWDEYIADRRFPIRVHTEVVAVEWSAKGRFSVRVNTSQEPRYYDALNVIAAPGNYQVPYVPAFAYNLGPEIQQLQVGTYKEPAMVSQGAVLVVGGGQTGVQISEELARAGRRVYLATSRVKGTPRTYRGEDILFWLDRMGVLTEPANMLSNKDADSERMPIVGHDHAISHSSLAELGVTLLGRLLQISSDGQIATFSDDLPTNIAFAQQGYRELIDQLDAWVTNRRSGQHAQYPEKNVEAAWEAPFTASSPAQLDLRECQIRAVVWATGWQANLDWLRIPEVCQALNHRGLPKSCETPVEGFFWLGFHSLRTRSSGIGPGFHLDAPYVATKLRTIK